MFFKIIVLWSVFLYLTSHTEGQEIQLTTRAPSTGNEDKLNEILAALNSQLGKSDNYLLGTVISYLLEELRSSQAQLNKLERKVDRDMRIQIAQLSNDTENRIQSQLRVQLAQQNNGSHTGSTYIRWGRKTCPDSTILVYTGIAGGKQHDKPGNGPNRLCLTNNPQFDNTTNPPYAGTLVGAEYQNIENHHDHDVPCSVCMAPYSITTIMIPATLTCPQGWTQQYNGHLASGHESHHSTEYVCLDRDPENSDSGLRNDDGLLFYYVVTRCGSLPCPPYVNDKVVTCVVCSK